LETRLKREKREEGREKREERREKRIEVINCDTKYFFNLLITDY